MNRSHLFVFYTAVALLCATQLQFHYSLSSPADLAFFIALLGFCCAFFADRSSRFLLGFIARTVGYIALVIDADFILQTIPDLSPFFISAISFSGVVGAVFLNGAISFSAFEAKKNQAGEG